MTCNSFVNPTQKFSDKVSTVESVTADIQSFDALLSYQTNPIIRFDTILLTGATIKLNEYLKSFSPASFLPYPSLNSRLEESNIPKIELADFMIEAIVDLDYLNGLITSELLLANPITYIPSSQIIDLITKLDDYYNKNLSTAIQGGFCSIYKSKLFQALGLLSVGSKLLSQLQNFSLNDVIGKLNTIKELMFQAIDQIKQRVMSQIKGLTTKISTITNTSVFNSLHKKTQNLNSMYSDTSIEKLKGTVEEILSKMAGQFKEITADVLSFLLFRSCQLSDILNSVLTKPVNDLKGQVNNIQGQLNVIQTLSNRNRAKAIEAGGIRLESNIILVGKQNLIRQVNSSALSGNSGSNGGSGSGQIAEELPNRYLTAEATDFERAMVATINENGNQYVHFSDKVKYMERDYPSSNPANNVEFAGIKKVHPDVWLKIFRVAEQMGVKFFINSAYRNENKNSAVGGARQSLHMSGMALDVDMSNINRDTFVSIARQVGFQGIGFYPSFIHVDIGAKRSW